MPENKTTAAPAANSTAIVEFSKTDAALADLKARYADLVLDVATRDGMQVAIKGRAELRGYRVALEKTRIDIKAPLLERERLIDAEAKRITAELLALEEPLDGLIKAEENRKEEERKAKEEEERKRIADITSRIEQYGSIGTAFVGRPPADIAKRLAELREEGIGTWAGEFKATAENARLRAIAALEQLYAGAVALQRQREEDARLASERDAELARLREEAAARAREDEKRRAEESQRIVAEGKARAEAEAIEKARREAEEKAHRDRLAAEERAAREKREADERAARDRIAKQEAEAKAKRDEEDARLRVEREAREAEEKRLEEQRQKLAAERREVERREAELLDGRARLTAFVEKFGAVKEFAAVTRHIKAFLAEQPKEQAA